MKKMQAERCGAAPDADRRQDREHGQNNADEQMVNAAAKKGSLAGLRRILSGYVKKQKGLLLPGGLAKPNRGKQDQSTYQLP